MKSTQEILGGFIRKLREERGLTQQELADSTELDRSHISDLERGIHSPSLNVIFSLCETLKVKPYDFIEKIYREYKKNSDR